MGKGTSSAPIQPFSSVYPGVEEKPGGQPSLAAPLVITVTLPLGTDAKTAASKAYLSTLWVAPTDGWWVADAFVAAVAVPDYAAVTLAIENYDKSATAGANLLSATNFDMETLTAKQGTQLTLSTTLANRMMDEGDTLWATLTTGATEVTAGQGISITLVLRGPEVDPQ